MLSLGFLIDVYQVEDVLLSLSVFTMKTCWILSSAFSASIEVIMRYLSFSLLIRCIISTDFHMLNQLSIPEANTTWSWYVTHFKCYWIWFASLLKIFLSVVFL